jgi:hypothetical protein
MTGPKDVSREVRDELLELASFDPEDASAALLAVKPEVDEGDADEPDDAKSDPQDSAQR